MNLAGFVLNNPINLVDPFGLEEERRNCEDGIPKEKPGANEELKNKKKIARGRSYYPKKESAQQQAEELRKAQARNSNAINSTGKSESLAKQELRNKAAAASKSGGVGGTAINMILALPDEVGEKAIDKGLKALFDYPPKSASACYFKPYPDWFDQPKAPIIIRPYPVITNPK